MSLNPATIQSLLDSEDIVYVATTKPNGDPHLTPMWFVHYNEKIYIYTDESTVKFKNILNNNHVALCFGGKDTYIIEGTTSWSKVSESSVPMRQLLFEKYVGLMDDSYISDDNLVFEIHIDKNMSWPYVT